MIKDLKITGSPPAIRRFAMALPDPGEAIIRECDTFLDLKSAIQDYPLEISLISQVDSYKVIERYFLVGLALPSGKDQFEHPLIYFTDVNVDQYEKIRKLVNDYGKDKSVIWSQ
jgi:hypothetical protein